MALYNLLIHVLTLMCLPFIAVGMLLWPRWRQGLSLRFGAVPLNVAGLQGRPCIWLHAASLGEMKAVRSLLVQLKRSLPRVPIILSATTVSGYKEALAMSAWCDGVTLLPLEFPWVLQRVFARLQPRLLILVETELWPNVIRAAKARGATVLVLNGRFSEKGARRYAWMGGLFGRLFAPVDLWAMRSQVDASRAQTLGVERSKIKVTGNIKFQDPPTSLPALDREFRTAFRGRPVLTAGSTRPGEERVVLDAFLKLRLDLPRLILVLAPRHLERMAEVERLLAERGLAYVKKSAWNGLAVTVPVLLLDTHGELVTAFKASTITFVGGSLVPLGGHNILEPAACGKAVMYGPHMGNFHDESVLLRDRGIGFLVRDAASLASVSRALLHNAPGRQRIAFRAKKLFQEKRLVVQNNVRLIVRLWNRSGRGR